MRSAALASMMLLMASSTGPALASPDLSRGLLVGSLTVYPDDRRSDLHYYGPGEVALATDAAGKPDLHLLLARYTGTAAAGDQGRILFRSLLTLRVVHSGAGPEALAAVKAALGGKGRIELRPLPIQHLESALVYAPLRPDAAAADATPLPAGQFETASEAPAASASAYWTERIYTLAPSPEEAQLFATALQGGQVALSLGYAFVARGKGAAPELDLTGGTVLAGELKRRLDSAIADSADGDELRASVVRAGATSIVADTARWPDLVRRVDINESMPPGYAALTVYCYDFNNGLRPDLYEKQVEIEARSVVDTAVILQATFRSPEADLYARNLRFPLAVRLDRPYRYRVTEVGLDGAVREGSWIEGSSWSRILDVTSPATDLERRDDAPDS